MPMPASGIWQPRAALRNRIKYKMNGLGGAFLKESTELNYKIQILYINPKAVFEKSKTDIKVPWPAKELPCAMENHRPHSPFPSGKTP